MINLKRRKLRLVGVLFILLGIVGNLLILFWATNIEYILKHGILSLFGMGVLLWYKLDEIQELKQLSLIK